MCKYELTIVTCTKNRIYFLKKKIKEFKKISKILNAQLIIVAEVDDAKSINYLKKIKNKSIKILIHNFNNINKSTNIAITHATGRYITIHGDDDYFIYSNLKILKDIFLRDYDWITARAKFYSDNEKNEIRKFTKVVKNIFIFLNFKFFLNSFNYLQCSSVFFKKEIAIKTGGYPKNIKYGSDHHFWKKILKYDNIVINNYLTTIRYSKSTISGSINSKKYFYLWREIVENKKILIKLFQFLFLMFLVIKDGLKKILLKTT